MEPHHLVVGLAMVVMAARMAGRGAMSGMAGMTVSPASVTASAVTAPLGWLSLSTLALIYM
jgi:hypothetical protein